MELKEFKEVNVRVAENQPEYITIPAFVNPKEGSITFCFELDQSERERIMDTGEIWFTQLTGGGKMQPVCCSTIKEDLIPKTEENEG